MFRNRKMKQILSGKQRQFQKQGVDYQNIEPKLKLWL